MIEELKILPNHVKSDDGYRYDEKYVGNLYKYNNSLLFFGEKSYMEFPLKIYSELESLINELRKETNNQVKQLDDSIKDSIYSVDKTDEIDTINNSLDTLKGEISKLEDSKNNLVNNVNTKISNIEQVTNEFEVKIKFLNDCINKLTEQVNKLDTMSQKDIEEIIDKKLSDVYNNFKQVSSQLTKSAVQEALKDSKRDQVGKLKMSSLAMLKELDYKPEDIKLLSEAGLI